MRSRSVKSAAVRSQKDEHARTDGDGAAPKKIPPAASESSESNRARLADMIGSGNSIMTFRLGSPSAGVASIHGVISCSLPLLISESHNRALNGINGRGSS